MNDSWNVVVVGLAITSSWGNGHATTYRSLLREFAKMGHRVLFLERDVPWYRDNRDMPKPGFCEVGLYATFDDLRETWRSEIKHADIVILGSFTPEGERVANWLFSEVRGVVAFYDIDTPVTLSALRNGRCEYLSPNQVPKFDVYLSFTGGPNLRRLETQFGARRARVLYCCADERLYFPENHRIRWDLGYMGTYSTDRQPSVDSLIIAPAKRQKHARFVIAGPQFPKPHSWPSNVQYVRHLPPASHRKFYNSQRFTLNVTRSDMIAAGYSPSVRLFEAASCGVAIISDWWKGLETIFDIGRELLITKTTEECCAILKGLPDEERIAIGQRARQRVLREHAATHRAVQLQSYLEEAMDSLARVSAKAMA
jgi:spore maturation protein CgeB